MGESEKIFMCHTFKNQAIYYSGQYLNKVGLILKIYRSLSTSHILSTSV